MTLDIPALIRLSDLDNVAIARSRIESGQCATAGNRQVVAVNKIEAGHKIAVENIFAGQAILKYGQTIGIAKCDIGVGEHVHVHNVEMVASLGQHSAGNAYVPTTATSEAATFEGYRRFDGRIATRNFLGVIASVNCSATVCQRIAQHFTPAVMQEFPNVDGVVAITHGQGCGMVSSGESMDVLRRTLHGYADQVNFAGVLVIGLGCEVNQVDGIVSDVGKRTAGLFSTLKIQEVGGTRETIDAGVAILMAMLPIANSAKRIEVSAKHLVVGLQCGGSDGYSGISANPVLGAAVDLLIQHGGTAILSETPEIYGAEHLLTARAATQAVADQLLARLDWWERYTSTHGADMNNNPSPGNKAGGITTILEKSLGAVAKGGSTGLMAVYKYAQPVRSNGLVFMDTPGYDPVSATGQIAGGANLICFTTGRGSTYGCKPTPSLKLATHTALFERMHLDMDFDAGTVIAGNQTIAEAGKQMFELMLSTASGRKTCSERNGLGDNEFVPWQLGAVM
jgi:altronate hydrolase